MNDQGPPWYDRPFTATVVGGIVVALVVWIVPWGISESTKAKVPWWVYLVVAGAALLVASVSVPPWRRLIWPPFARWLTATWPVTTRRLRRENATSDASGYARRSMEIDIERARTPQPAWRVDQRSSLAGDETYILYNSGWPASSVRLTTDRTEMALDGDVFFKGPLGDNSIGSVQGKQFTGFITDTGRRDGVTFRIEWVDQSGDARSGITRLERESIRTNERDSREKSLERKIRDLEAESAMMRLLLDQRHERINALERQVAAEGEQSGRLDHKQGGTELTVDRTSQQIQPRWSVVRDPQGTEHNFSLLNAAGGSVVANIRVDAAPELFQFLDAAQWPEQIDGGVYRFIGKELRGAFKSGIPFTVHWVDAQGLEQEAVAHLDRMPRTGVIY